MHTLVTTAGALERQAGSPSIDPRGCSTRAGRTMGWPQDGSLAPIYCLGASNLAYLPGNAMGLITKFEISADEGCSL